MGLNVLRYLHILLRLLIGWGFCPRDTPSDGIQHLVGTGGPIGGGDLWLATVVIKYNGTSYAEFRLTMWPLSAIST